MSRPPADDGRAATAIELVTGVDDARAVDQYVKGQASPRSRASAQGALRRIARMVLGPQATAEEFPWSALNYESVMRVRRGLSDLTREGRFTPGTANLTLSHLRGIMRVMYGMRIISNEQLSAVHPGMLKGVPGSRLSRGKMLLPDEEKRLRAAALALDGYQGGMLDAAIVLAVSTGLRREEVAALTVDRLLPGEISVIGKGNKERKVPTDADFDRELAKWLKERAGLNLGHNGVFCAPWRPSLRLSSWSFWTLVRDAAHEAFGSVEWCDDGCACLETVTGPHDFRRTFASRLLDQGFDIREVQVLMGHASPETTARYDKRATENLFAKRRNTRVLAE